MNMIFFGFLLFIPVLVLDFAKLIFHGFPSGLEIFVNFLLDFVPILVDFLELVLNNFSTLVPDFTTFGFPIMSFVVDFVQRFRQLVLDVELVISPSLLNGMSKILSSFGSLFKLRFIRNQEFLSSFGQFLDNFLNWLQKFQFVFFLLFMGTFFSSIIEIFNVSFIFFIRNFHFLEFTSQKNDRR